MRISRAYFRKAAPRSRPGSRESGELNRRLSHAARASEGHADDCRSDERSGSMAGAVVAVHGASRRVTKESAPAPVRERSLIKLGCASAWHALQHLAGLSSHLVFTQHLILCRDRMSH